MAQNHFQCYFPHCTKRSLTHCKIVSTSTLLWEEDLLRTRPQGSWLSLMLPHSPLVMWCSAAVDVLFLMDGSHSVGKGSFERSKHFAITVCDALDINPRKVSLILIVFVLGCLAASDRKPIVSGRGHLLACGTRKIKGMNPGSWHDGIPGLNCSFSPPLHFAFLIWVPPQAGSPYSAELLYTVLQAIYPQKKKVDLFPCRAGLCPQEGSDWADVGHMTIPLPITEVRGKSLSGHS